MPEHSFRLQLVQRDRSQYPSRRPDGSLDIELASGKYLKRWQGRQYPGVTLDAKDMILAEFRLMLGLMTFDSGYGVEDIEKAVPVQPASAR